MVQARKRSGKETLVHVAVLRPVSFVDTLIKIHRNTPPQLRGTPILGEVRRLRNTEKNKP